MIGQTLANGSRHAVPMVLGVMSGNAIAMTVCFAGVGALLSANEYAFLALRWAGACYLVFLGVRCWRRFAQVLLGQGVALDLGKLMRASHGHFVDRVGVRQVVGDRRMASLMHGETMPFVLVDRHCAQRAYYDPVPQFVEMPRAHAVEALTLGSDS